MAFYTIHEVLMASILGWLPLPPSVNHVLSEPSAMTLFLGWPYMPWLIASLNYLSPFATKRQWSMKGNWRSNTTLCWIIEKAKGFQKNIYLCFFNKLKHLVVYHEKLWKALREMEIPVHHICFLRNHMGVKKQQLKPFMEQMIGSRSKKE